jgi:hypothetical protein
VSESGLCIKPERPGNGESLVVDADGIRNDCQETLNELRKSTAPNASRAASTFVALDTSLPFDRALVEFLVHRKARF